MPENRRGNHTPAAPPPVAAVLLNGEETGSVVSATTILVPARNPGPPLHAHDFDEAFYVLDGEVTFQIGDTLTRKRAGELCFAPRNTAHALANHSDDDARYLLICTPAGFERQWARLAAEVSGGEPPPWAQQPIPEITVLGPPIPMH
jgi:quercetin dioxygenase-like cupin family protein